MTQMLRPLNTTWWPFIRTMVMTAAILAIVFALRFRDPRDASVAVVFAILWLSTGSFLGFRWHVLRRDLSRGTLSEAEFRLDPSGKLIGPRKPAVIWIASTVLVILAVAVISTIKPNWF